MSDRQQSGNGKPDHLLALRGFSKSFGPVQAMSDVDFEVDAGVVVALVGDNGAGKSTLIKAIDGVQPPDSGEAYFEGRRVKITDPNTATKLGIATVHQDLALCDNLDVVANLYSGAGGDRRRRYPAAACSTRPRWRSTRASSSTSSR